MKNHINSTRPGIHIDEFANTGDPYTRYATMREEFPVCQLEPKGIWAISRYKDIEFICKRPKIFSSSGMKALLQPEWMPDDCKRTLSVLTLDPPEHTPLRRKIDSAVGHQRILKALAQAMHNHAERLVDKIAHSKDTQTQKTCQQKECDFIAEFASPYIETFINRVIGLENKKPPPKEMADHPEMTNRNISDIPSDQYIQDQITSIRKSKNYFGPLINDWHNSPENDLISTLALTVIDGEPLTNNEIRNAVELVSLAGTQGPTMLLAHAMIRFSRQPELLHQLIENPKRISSFIEELLRHISPAPAVLRKTTAAITLSGVEIPEGATMLLLYASANRDPRMFDDPDTFDMSRSNIKQHLAFGYGPHFCAGAALTRLEVRIALEAIIAKFQHISCPPDHEINWNNSWMANTMRDLPIQFTIT
ncbi:MAG: cytochrome P450 [Kordiimonadaceae bacterium]|nr:cytochrome P450 [Kordiimonadaceae bacterium]